MALQVSPSPLALSASSGAPKTVTVVGDTVYYSTDKSVSSTANQGSLSTGATLKITAPTFFCTARTVTGSKDPGSAALSVSDDRPTVTGSKGGNAALTSLLQALAAQGIVVDKSS